MLNNPAELTLFVYFDLVPFFTLVTTLKINAKCWQRNMPKHILPSDRFHSTKGRKVDKLSVNPVFFNRLCFLNLQLFEPQIVYFLILKKLIHPFRFFHKF